MCFCWCSYFAFLPLQRGTCCIQIEDDRLIKFGCIGYTLGVLFFFFFNRYSCVSLQCPVLSLVTTILSFSFHVVDRHRLIEILGYVMSF